MVKDETILILAGVGIVGYGLLKSNFFKGIGEGIGDASEGAGTFVKETFIQGGETLRDVGQVIQYTTEGAGKILYEVGEGGSGIIKEAGSLGVDILGEETGIRGVFKNLGGFVVDNTAFIREAGTKIRDNISNLNFKDVVLPVTSLYEKTIENVKNKTSKIRDSITTEINKINENKAVLPSQITPKTEKTTLRNTLNNTFSLAKEKTKDLLSNLSSKLRNIF